MIVPIFIAPYAKNILHATSWQFGLIETGFSVGFIIGCVVLPWVADKKGEVKTIVYALIVSAFLYFVLALVHSVLVAFILYFVIGMSISCWAISVTLAQKNTDISLQGKTQGLSYGLSGVMIMAIYTSFLIINNAVHFPSNYWFYFIIGLTFFIIYPLLKGKRLYEQEIKLKAIA